MKVLEKHDRFGLGYRATSRHPAARGGKKLNAARFSSAGYLFDSFITIVDGATPANMQTTILSSGVLRYSSSTTRPLP